jgi:hypothetical protein
VESKTARSGDENKMQTWEEDIKYCL